MKTLRSILLVTLIITTFISCEKKQLANAENKHLQMILDRNGEWKVDLFEINGEDSTNQQLGVVGSGNYCRQFKFKPKLEKSDLYYSVDVAGFIGSYYFDASDKNKIFFHDYGINCPSGTIYKPGKLHNVFLLIPHSDTEWIIETLNSNEFILSSTYKKNYLIKLSKSIEE